MCATTKNYSWLIVFIELFSGGLFLAGILVISLARTEQCNSGCYEHSCLGTNYRYYECDCGAYCQSKAVIVDGVFRMAVAFIVLGVIGSIFGCILGCIFRRRYYYNNPPPVVIANPNPPIVYGIAQPVYAQPQQPGMQQQGMQPAKMEQYPNQPAYGYGQPLPQNMAYGYPIQGPGFGDPNQNQNPMQNPQPYNQ